MPPWKNTDRGSTNACFGKRGLSGRCCTSKRKRPVSVPPASGCFFDDPVHRVLGWYPDTQFQSLYHFTIGGAVEDHRLTTLPPYGDLNEGRGHADLR